LQLAAVYQRNKQLQAHQTMNRERSHS
jgi:hypothetical protein